ncbi:MAG: hypothetical protein PHU81_01970 [Acidobacteriota bacterium]|nr:hypothetical protein [Acidobacteriota bacterium]
MNEIRTAYLNWTPSAGNQKEGLPVWIFYIVLCAGLLLLFLAFLHNKDLRNKINNIFLVPRKRFMKFWLELALRRVEEKENRLLIQLGQQGAAHWPELKDRSEARPEINSLIEQGEQLKEASPGDVLCQLEPHYTALGLIIDRIRPRSDALAKYYLQIDEARRKIQDLKKELENI